MLPRELADCYQNGASVIYYQHKARRSDDFISNSTNSLFPPEISRAAGMGLKFITTSQRFYFFILQPKHASQIHERAADAGNRLAEAFRAVLTLFSAGRVLILMSCVLMIYFLHLVG